MQGVDVIAQGGEWHAARERLRRDSVTGLMVRRLAKGWRALTGGSGVRDDADSDRAAAGDLRAGRRTLLACSGGADSSALVVGLCAGVAKARERFVVGHVVHDLRSSVESLADRDRVRALAGWVGVGFVEAGVRVRGEGSGGGAGAGMVWAGEGTNLESRARQARYRALAKLAHEQRCGYVASAHQVDDAMETVLMRLLRGSAGVGLGGVHHTRSIGRGIVLVRPMLCGEGLTRADAERVCGVAGIAFVVDASNKDETRLRAYLRARVSPALRGVRRDAATRIASAGRLLAEAGSVVRARAEEIAAVSITASEKDGQQAVPAIIFDRSRLAGEERIVLGEVVRAMHARLASGGGLDSASARDRLNARVLGDVSDRIKDGTVHPRIVTVGRMVVTITSKRVRFALRANGSGNRRAKREQGGNTSGL